METRADHRARRPCPYNAVWTRQGLVGLIDWDNVGPVHADDDLAWVVFSWTPLHAAEVVEREGFTAFSKRRERLGRLLRAYGWSGTTEQMLTRVDARLRHQVTTMRAIAATGDPAYQQMLEQQLDHALESARAQLAAV